MEDIGKNLPAKKEAENVSAESLPESNTLEISEEKPIFFIRVDNDRRTAYFVDSNKYYWVYEFNTNLFRQLTVKDESLPHDLKGLMDSRFKKFTSSEDAMMYGMKMSLLDSYKLFNDSIEDKNLSDGIRDRSKLVATRYKELLDLIDEMLSSDPGEREELKKQYEEKYKNLAK